MLVEKMNARGLVLSLFLTGSSAWKNMVRRRLDENVTAYQPGNFSLGSVLEDPVRGTKIFLSNGLAGRALAHDGEPVVLDVDNGLSATYHNSADGGACIGKTDGSGGYYCVSNSEQGSYPDSLTGGVYSLEFNANHEFIGYQQVMGNTALNCAGGKTPWNTWVSCEEHREHGRCWQVDPTGAIEARPTNVTGLWGVPDYGNWEAFAWDDDAKIGYVTNDDTTVDGLPSYRGAVVRYTPDATALACLDAGSDAEKWCALESGTHDYLWLDPDAGTFEWVANVTDSNPELYQGTEGVHVENGMLTLAAVVERVVFRLNLNDMTYIKKPVPFSQEPDNLRIIGDTLYLCTDGDHAPGDAVWGWDDVGAFRVFYEEGHNYPAGVSFSPDNKYMYTSMWGEATLQFWREDGFGFDDAPEGTVYEVPGGLDAVE